MVLVISACIFGCGSAVRTVSVPAQPEPAAPNRYHAYGDSITYGATLATVGEAYPYLIAGDRSLTVTDYAIVGDEACDIPTRQIFPAADDPVADYPLYTLMIGTNDADVKGPGAYEAVFNECYQASLAWLAVPARSKVLASSSSVTTSGPGSVDPASMNAWHTTAAGASISFPIRLTSKSAVYLWPRIVDGDAGTFTYAIDGVVLGTLSTSTSPAIATRNGSTSSLGFLRIAGVATGDHRLKFTQTSLTGSMQIVAVGVPPLAQAVPVVLVGEVPLQEAGTKSPCTYRASICDAFTADIKANVALFKGDGLDVRFAENHTFMLGTPTEMNDELHPNVLGQSELRHAFEALLP